MSESNDIPLWRRPRWNKILRCLCAGLILTHAIPLHANPEGGVVSAGDATITNNASTVHIDQHTDRAVIDWRGFDIAPNERTEFQQPGSGSIALNRVNSTTASHIDGQLSANGNIVIVNQNGVVFGRGAQVDVNSLVATTSDIGNDRFMAGGKLVFDKPGNPDAQIINEGTITAKDAGLVGLVAPPCREPRGDYGASWEGASGIWRYGDSGFLWRWPA